ncbi:MAG TPA: ABC transporter ATP-binding protein [Dehalococcoidia bacterium]|nr:ABC transporter ATP-binding protein [Dehalococcoidia bacterium]
MIELKGITKTFRQRDGSAFHALKDVDLKVLDGEFLSIIGPSGCGKTTLMRMVGGLAKADAGEIFIDGRRVNGPGPERAIVFQNFVLLPWVDVTSNVTFGLEMRGLSKKEARKTAQKEIERVGLTGFEGHYPHELSGGMQQRVGLARALAVNPEILLMDEPFASVDAQTRQILQDDLIRIWQEERKTVIFITHSMEEAVYLSDRVAVMERGPGRISELFDIHLPRPRDYSSRNDVEFTSLTTHIWGLLKTAYEKDGDVPSDD